MSPAVSIFSRFYNVDKMADYVGKRFVSVADTLCYFVASCIRKPRVCKDSLVLSRKHREEVDLTCSSYYCSVDQCFSGYVMWITSLVLHLFHR